MAGRRKSEPKRLPQSIAVGDTVGVLWTRPGARSKYDTYYREAKIIEVKRRPAKKSIEWIEVEFHNSGRLRLSGSQLGRPTCYLVNS